MADSRLPQGTKLADGGQLGRVISTLSNAYWLHALKDGRRALVLTEAAVSDLENSFSIKIEMQKLTFGSDVFRVFVSNEELDALPHLLRPNSVVEAMPFALALAKLSDDFTDAVFSRELESILPFRVSDRPALVPELVLGRYLSGGIDIFSSDIVALERIVTKIEAADLERIVSAAGIAIKSAGKRSATKRKTSKRASNTGAEIAGPFTLAGRKQLSEFFNEHVVDIVANEARYAALGIGFPGGIILEGPTGCGKTFAVERLIEHLGWPSFSIDASSIASPYIHETSRKVAEVFAEAKKAAPAVVVIDEMDAFLTERSSGGDQHRLEEVAEFLRRIPEASANRVLIIAMTNKIDLIDPAILRRGRFDHVIHVDHAGPAEVEGLLTSLLADIPHDLTDLHAFAADLSGRPLSDAAFVVREAGRLAARAGRDRIGSDDMQRAFAGCSSRNSEDRPRMGF